MNNIVHKFAVKEGRNHVSLPKNAQILTILEQYHSLQMWVLLDIKENTTELAEIEICYTVEKIDVQDGCEAKHISTFLSAGFVYHAFEIVKS